MQEDEVDDPEFSKTMRLYEDLESKFSYPLDMKKQNEKFRLYS